MLKNLLTILEREPTSHSLVVALFLLATFAASITAIAVYFSPWVIVGLLAMFILYSFYMVATGKDQ